MRGRRFERRLCCGVTIMLVVVMLTLVAASVLAMSLVFAMEMRRTQAAVGGAQLRQLLLAAPVFAEAELRTGGEGLRTVAVDVPVAGATLALVISPEEGGMVVRARATMNRLSAVQVLRYVRTAGPGSQLVLREARLVESP